MLTEPKIRKKLSHLEREMQSTKKPDHKKKLENQIEIIRWILEEPAMPQDLIDDLNKAIDDFLLNSIEDEEEKERAKKWLERRDKQNEDHLLRNPI